MLSAGAKSWVRASEGLTDFNIDSLIVSRDDSRTIYAGTRTQSIFVNRDRGQSWQ
jgi:hypothetical protein